MTNLDSPLNFDEERLNSEITKALLESHPNGTIISRFNASENTLDEGFVLLLIESVETIKRVKQNRYFPFQSITKNDVNVLEQFTFGEEDGIVYKFITEKWDSINPFNAHTMRHQSNDKVNEVLGLDDETEIKIRYYNVFQYMNGAVGFRFTFTN